jgi:hypothetical protein
MAPQGWAVVPQHVEPRSGNACLTLPPSHPSHPPTLPPRAPPGAHLGCLGPCPVCLDDLEPGEVARWGWGCSRGTLSEVGLGF